MGGGAGEHVPMSASVAPCPPHPMHLHLPRRGGLPCPALPALLRVPEDRTPGGVVVCLLLRPADARLLPCAAAAARAGPAGYMQRTDASAGAGA